VLTLREQPFIVMSRLSNRSGIGIMFGEILPNVLTLVTATLVGAISGALLVAIGLQLLGLGPAGVPTLGLTLQTAISGGALSQGLWWWWSAPTVLLILLFLGLFVTSLVVDEIANPRLKKVGHDG
jgi:peptide/nickel transport system permease protein